MFSALDAIDTLLESLNNDLLTPEQIAVIQNQIDQAKASFEELYGTLLEQFKEERNALIAQAKLDSAQALEMIKEQYKARIQQYKDAVDTAKGNANNNSWKNRIKAWQED